MVYLVGLLVFALIVYLFGRLGNRDNIFAYFGNLDIFNLHYLLAGILFFIIIPAQFIPLFESIRGTVLLFGMSWIGLFYGCGLELRIHQKFPSHIIFFNIIEPVFVFVIIATSSIVYLYLKAKGWQHTGTALMIGLFSSFTIFRRHGILNRQKKYKPPSCS